MILVSFVDSLQSPMEHLHGKAISGTIVKAKPIKRSEVEIIDEPMECNISKEQKNFEASTSDEDFQGGYEL